MKNVLSIAFAMALIGAAVSPAPAQGTGGSPGRHIHSAAKPAHGTHYSHDRGGKKHHPKHTVKKG